jgi:nitrile hydratase accessory protein
LSPPDPDARSRLSASLPRERAGPTFAEPWQARAFGLAVLLCERGHFTWSEWTAVFAPRLRRGAPEDPAEEHSSYYRDWLATLETLALRKHLADSGELSSRRQAWEQAYRRTPHGRPVELAAEAANPAG